MIRALNLAMLALTVMICFGLYRVTHAAQEREADLHKIESQIGDEERAIGVLKAEWTHLAQPAKVQAMATHYLDLEPMKATQIAYVNDLPMRQPGQAATLADLQALPFAAQPDIGPKPIPEPKTPAPRAKPQHLGR